MSSLIHDAFVMVWQVIDTAVAVIQARFQQEDTVEHTNVATLLMTAIHDGISDPATRELAESVSKFYSCDLSKENMLYQLTLLPTLANLPKRSKNIMDVVSRLRETTCSPLISEVMKSAQIMLTLPCSNAVSERSFSMLRRAKTYLRSTLTQLRLNSVMTCYI